MADLKLTVKPSERLVTLPIAWFAGAKGLEQNAAARERLAIRLANRLTEQTDASPNQPLKIDVGDDWEPTTALHVIEEAILYSQGEPFFSLTADAVGPVSVQLLDATADSGAGTTLTARKPRRRPSKGKEPVEKAQADWLYARTAGPFMSKSVVAAAKEGLKVTPPHDKRRSTVEGQLIGNGVDSCAQLVMAKFASWAKDLPADKVRFDFTLRTCSTHETISISGIVRPRQLLATCLLY